MIVRIRVLMKKGEGCATIEDAALVDRAVFQQSRYAGEVEVATPVVCAVADGIGGHAEGHLASRAVVEALAHSTSSGTLTQVRQKLEEVGAGLNAKAKKFAPGTAVVGVMLDDGGLFTCFWAGDCVGYVIVDGELVWSSEPDIVSVADRKILSNAIGAGSLNGGRVNSKCGRGYDQIILATDGFYTQPHFNPLNIDDWSRYFDNNSMDDKTALVISAVKSSQKC